MVGVVSEPWLQQARVAGVVHFAATIDESFGDVPNLRDVKVRGNFIAIRKDKTRERVRMTSENGFQIFQLHASIYIPY
jgi:hypothetical protein